MRTRIALTALSAIAGLGALVGFAGQASAANSSAETTTSGTGYIKQFTTSFTSPSTRSIPVHTGLSEGTPVEVHCFREGDKINGNGYWFVIENDDKVGYVHRDALWAPATTPHC